MKKSCDGVFLEKVTKVLIYWVRFLLSGNIEKSVQVLGEIYWINKNVEDLDMFFVDMIISFTI